jgi:hypothetical protein
VCTPSATLAGHEPDARASNVAGTLAGSSAHTVCATASSGSVAETEMARLLYQPLSPFGADGASEIVVVGGVRSLTVYATPTVLPLPALSFALQLSVWGPTVLVSTESQLDEATPEVVSVACGDALTPVSFRPMLPASSLSVGLRSLDQDRRRRAVAA